MRKPIIAGNWKMNKTPSEAKALVEALKPLVADAGCDVVVCVPALDFAAVKEAAEGSNIGVGVQNMHWKESGAYTGELSAAMIKEAGAQYVIIGHSERRRRGADPYRLRGRKEGRTRSRLHQPAGDLSDADRPDRPDRRAG